MKVGCRVWFAALPALLALGCHTAPAPVPMVGSPANVDALAGEWGGDYSSESTGRSGSIVFRLTAQADTAHGDVIMIPRERRESSSTAPSPSVGIPIPRAPEILSIAFVRAGDAGGVSGRLKLYRDPECDCELDTSFEGRIQGDVIQGTYTSRRVDGNGASQTGTWKVTRKQP